MIHQMKKSILTKYLPFVAAVLLAASCGKDNNGDGIVAQPSSAEESAQSVQSLDASNTVAIPFSVRVSGGASLSKIQYTERDGDIDKVVDREFTPSDCGNIQLSVSGEGTAALLDLKSRDEGGKTIYYFGGAVNVVPGKEDAFKSGGIDLVGTFTTNGESTTYYSTTSLLNLEQNCKHEYKAEFKSNDESITLVDQNAYLCFSVYLTEFTLVFNGEKVDDKDVERTFKPDPETHKIWIAVPCDDYGKPSVKGALISESGMDLEPGTVYNVDRHYLMDRTEFVDLGTDDGILWATCNIGANNPWDYGDYYAWGETVPYYNVGHAYDAPCSSWRKIEGRTITGYNWATYSGFDGDESGSNFTKYKGENSSTLSEGDDVAYQTNNAWRMPTKSEFANLKSKCYWVWTSDYDGSGKSGYIVYKAKDADHAGKVKYASSGDDFTMSYTDLTTDTHIFLPAAGYRDGSNLIAVGFYGSYWASSLYAGGPTRAYDLYFYSDDVSAQSRGNRRCGRSVRAVRRK